MSVSISASERGLIARNATGCFKMSSTVADAKGTEPISSVGFKRITSRISIFQQSPTCGRRPIGGNVLAPFADADEFTAGAEREKD